MIGKDAEVLDFTGPLEVFAQAYTQDGKPLFAPYIVAGTLEPVTVGGGMKVVPDHTFKTAPAPKIIVIPAMAMDAATPEMIDWIRTASKSTDVTMSVCNGAFVLAKTGLLSGKRATAHHGGYFRFAGMYPDIRLKRGARFVEDGNIASAGGVSSGIDLALRVVERYVGREIARHVADVIEYQGNGWLNPESNEAYAKMPTLDENRRVCPLCLWKAIVQSRLITRERHISSAPKARRSSSRNTWTCSNGFSRKTPHFGAAPSSRCSFDVT